MSRTPVTKKDKDREELKRNLAMTQKDRLDRRCLNIIKLRLQGLTVDEVAERLNITTATVGNSIQRIRKANSKYVENFNQKDFVGETLSVYNTIEQDAWAQLDSLPLGDARRSKFLSAVRDSRKEQVKLLQNSGLLHKEAEKVEVQVTTHAIDEWSDDQKKKISEAMVEASLDDFIALPEPEKKVGMPSKEEFDLDEFAEFVEEAKKDDS